MPYFPRPLFERRHAVGFGLLLVTAGLVYAARLHAGAPREEPPRTVPSVDLKRYAGRWFEIARYPNKFQDQCVSDSVAEYVLREEGRLEVTNECRTADGEIDRARGEVRVAVADGSNAKLKVRFAPALLSIFPFVWGDYWILALAADYSHVVVGSPDRKYLWILARRPTLEFDRFERLLDRVRELGFDPSRLEITRHTGIPATVPPPSTVRLSTTGRNVS